MTVISLDLIYATNVHPYDWVSMHAHLSAELSGSMNRISGGADSVSVANIPPCSCTPKPFSGSPVKTTSLVST